MYIFFLAYLLDDAMIVSFLPFLIGEKIIYYYTTIESQIIILLDSYCSKS